ncbi:peroxiredoxin [Peptoniphilus raoultii]|uniref:peroxiredoxin n=1 Tax=Peptoniphilus raoultii TaxID=1776387 RepID=UPI0008DA2039|nr:peroxiredoxin [Peptoniphilus raoultii]
MKVLKTNFCLESSEGLEKNLSDYKGSILVLYFYPKDYTKGCTIEALEFSDLNDEFEKLGAKVVGISKDKVTSHKNFKNKENLKQELLADPDRKIHKEFGVLKDAKMYGKDVIKTVRSTFIFNRKGELVKEFRDVKAEDHAREVLKYIKENDL